MMGGMTRTARPSSIQGLCRKEARVLSMVSSALPLPSRQVNGQGAFHGVVGAEQVIVHLALPGGVAQVLAEALEVGEVLLAQPLRIDQEFMVGDFEVAELRPLLERKLDLLRRQDVEQHHLVPPM